MYDKKYLKELYNMNQDLKKVFESYYVYENGIVLNKDMSNKKKGVVASTPLYIELNKPGHVILVNSQLLFEIFKNYKMSQIEGMVVKDLRIGAMVDGEFKLFAIYQQANDDIIGWLRKNSLYINTEYEAKVSLSEDNILSLVNKESVNIYIGSRRIILCKAVVPTLKKTSNIDIHMQNKMEDNIFHCKLIIDNGGGCLLTQVFRCLNV